MSKKSRFPTIEAALLAGLLKSNEPDGCWLWQKATTNGGYGVFRYEWELRRAHCVSFQVYKGEIPAGAVVCHRCDTPRCANPDHIFVGTQKDNMQDMAAKQRGQHGERNKNAKLTSDKVREIRVAYAAGGVTHAALAATYGVTRETVRDTISRKQWAHVS